MQNPKIKKIDPQAPDPDLIEEAAGVIRRGGVVVFPTRCLYGLGADAMDPDAVEGIIRIKKRPPDNPILVLIHAEAQLQILVENIPPAAVAIMAAFWPRSGLRKSSIQKKTWHLKPPVP